MEKRKQNWKAARAVLVQTPSQKPPATDLLRERQQPFLHCSAAKKQACQNAATPTSTSLRLQIICSKFLQYTTLQIDAFPSQPLVTKLP